MLAIVGYSLWPSRQGTARYLVALTINGVDGRPRTSGRVWQSQVELNTWTAAKTFRSKRRGEAILVPDGAGGYFVALLRNARPDGSLGSDQTVLLPERLFSSFANGSLNPGEYSDRSKLIAYIGRQIGLTTNVSYVEGLGRGLPLPFIIHLPDANRPTEVDGLMGAEALARSAPKLTMTITQDRVSTGIESQLPWLAEAIRNHETLDGKPYDASHRSGLANTIGAGDFSTEIR
jgi:hypothetical protein